MPLHLVVPGLLWPKDTVREATRDLPLPGLSALLGLGRTVGQPAQPFERWLCRAFGIEADEPPCAALRLLGEGVDPGGTPWICADPVHLRFARDTLIFGNPHELELTQEEADRLAAALNEHLAEFGEFLALHPQRWYLRPKHPPQIGTHPLSAVVGRTIEAFTPRGGGEREWRRIANETQVLLHNHPLNAAREDAGRATANSLWFWGAGTLPAAASKPAPVVYGDDPLVRGLAKLAGADWAPLPEAADTGTPVAADGFVVIDDLAGPAQALDPHAWREALGRLEQRWFGPLRAALKSRRLKGLRLTALGDEKILVVTLGANDLWKFWRRPKSLMSLMQAAPRP